MKNNLVFDFSVNKGNSTITVKREFAAGLTLVWDAYTKSEILDRWWAPKPWVSKTKSMEFREGGRRLYAMCGPQGEESWALADFKSITPQANFKFSDAFCDKDGNVTEDFPGSDWNVSFKEVNGLTVVTIEIKHKTLSDLEKIIELGFKEGFTIALDGLDDLLLTLKQ